VAGYSRLMGTDEEGTHERLKGHISELIEPKIAEHRGRIVKNTGATNERRSNIGLARRGRHCRKIERSSVPCANTGTCHARPCLQHKIYVDREALRPVHDLNMRIAMPGWILLVFKREDPFDVRMRVLDRAEPIGDVQHEAGPVLMMRPHEFDILNTVISNRLAGDREIVR
jgi:hypothetical protein